ncbi:MAG: MBL fold metallo-hydrolase [Thermoanaerobaculia bacterium]|nr:MBL fold metallo-hydrolase [Thermoanaerobaculia bacterium]
MPTPFPVGPVNTHLVLGEPLTLVDTGPLTDDGWAALRAGLGRHGLAVSDVERVLLTHGHQDHFGLAARIEREGRAQFFGGRLDREHFRGRRNRRLLLDALARAGFGALERLTMVAMTAAVDHYADPLPDWDELSGGEVLPGDGWSVVVRSVPGHTPGSLTFEVPEAGVLFTGDTVLRDITPNAIVDEDPERPGEAFRSVSRYFASLDSIEAEESCLLTGHGGRIVDFGAHRAKLEGRYAFRVGQIERALSGKPKSVSELCRRIFPTVRPMDLFLAYSEVLGFLMYLEDLGRAERIPGRPTDRWTLSKGSGLPSTLYGFP